jgi:AFG3 family protein
MFRPATPQLARSFARLSLSTTLRPTYRTAAFAKIAPAAGVSSSRSYSSRPPQRPKNIDNNNSKKKVDNNNDSGERPPGSSKDEKPSAPSELGWVWLSEAELVEIRSVAETVQIDKAKIDKLIKDIEANGVPIELRDLLEKHRTVGLGMMDGIRVVRMFARVASSRDQIKQFLADQESGRRRGTTDFNSNKPGQEETSSPTEGKEKEGERQQRENGQQQDQPGKGQQQGSKGSSGKKDGKPEPNKLDSSDIGVGLGSMILFYAFYSLFTGESSREITWQELQKNFLDKGLVEKMVVEGDHRVRVELNREATQSVYPDTIAARPGFHYYFSIGSIDAFERRLDEAQAQLGIPSSERIPVSYAAPGIGANLLFAFGPTLLLVGLLMFISRKAGGGGGGAGGMFGFGKSKAKMFNHDSAVKVKFADVAGMDEAKMEIMEFVSFLRSPERFQKLGAKIPRGAVLSGPPGTGKTLLAKATAGESQVPFFSVSGSEFVEMFVGVGASRVRDLFANARKNAPCIIFIDEIDAIGRSRSEGKFQGSNDEREATLNQILTEMDGFNTSEQVVVLAGTNRPDILDQALMRPGRFDRHIHIDRPTMKGRQDIFKVHLKQIVTKEDIEYLTGRLAALTPGFAGADIANAVNEAALVGECYPSEEK